MAIDYRAAQAQFTKQKAALTRAVNSGDPDKVKATVKKARDEWDRAPFNGAWPDDWSRWQRALDDVLPWNQRIQIEEL